MNHSLNQTLAPTVGGVQYKLGNISAGPVAVSCVRSTASDLVLKKRCVTFVPLVKNVTAVCASALYLWRGVAEMPGAHLEKQKDPACESQPG